MQRVKHVVTSVVTESRMSIRESLRVFKKYENFIHKHRPPSYEIINKSISPFSIFKFESSSNSGSYQDSCGLTMRCFVDLFIADKATRKRWARNRTQGYDIDDDFVMNGPNIFQLYHNLNVVFHSMRFNNSFISNALQSYVREYLLVSASQVINR
jgi:hypothetical protein